MQFRTVEAKAVSVIVNAFAKVMAMTPENQALAGLSVSPKGNRTIQQTSSPKGAIDGKSGQSVPEGTLCNLWQSGTDAKDVRVFIVKPKSAKAPKAKTTDALTRMDALEANSAAQDAKLDAILAALTANK
jgi:hypothetical protein